RRRLERRWENRRLRSPGRDAAADRHRYKEKCWPEAERMERFEVDKVIENGEEAFAQYRLWMKDGRLIRNTEYFRFLGGKIEEIEVFFGNAQAFHRKNG